MRVISLVFLVGVMLAMTIGHRQPPERSVFELGGLLDVGC